MAASAIIEDIGKKPPVTAMSSIQGEDSLVLNLVIDDPDVSDGDQEKRAEGHARNTFAISALEDRHPRATPGPGQCRRGNR